MLLDEAACEAVLRTAPTAGIRIAARIPIIAITVSSSIKVKPARGEYFLFIDFKGMRCNRSGASFMDSILDESYEESNSFLRLKGSFSAA